MADEEWPIADPSNIPDTWSEAGVDTTTYSDYGETDPALAEGNPEPQQQYRCEDFPLVTSDILAKYGPRRSSTPTDQDQMSLDRLSPELIDLVGKWFCTSSFNPGRLYPQQVPDEHGGFSVPEDGSRVLPPCPKAFGALNSRLYREYRESLWSGSTWVIREGSPIYSTNFLLDIPESIWHSIRSVELKFTLKDLGLSSDVSAGDGGSTDVTSGESAGPTNGNSTQLTDEDGANNHRNDVSSSNEDNTTLETDLTTIWWDKFYAISSLNLTHLLLQNFLGDNLVATLVPFSNGTPANFEIIAPNETVAARLRGIIVARNM